MNRTFFLSWVAMAKQGVWRGQTQKERKYFAKQIVSFRLCGEIKPVLRYPASGKMPILIRNWVRFSIRLIMIENEQSATRLTKTKA
jgi:hypothetical protein